MSLAGDLQSYLANELGLVDGSTDWPSSLRRVHDGTVADPVNRLVILTEDGGPPPETPAPPGSQGDVAWRRPAVQVRVRGLRFDDEDAFEKAQEIWDALHGLNAVAIGAVEYIGFRCLTELIPIGRDKAGRSEVTFSVEMTRPVRVPASL